MRIIDKNKDFYDYYQDIYKDNTFTFDRRGSFLLTKDIICQNIGLLHNYKWNYKKRKYELKEHYFILLQVCNNFWLFLIKPTKITKDNQIDNYNVELLSRWRNYNKPRKLCNLELIDFPYYYGISTEDKIHHRIKDLIFDIDTNNYRTRRNLSNYTIYNGNEKIEKHIPLLRASGLSSCIIPQEIYLAFEEYFALEKSSSERREPLGTTDTDKIESHGFDKKISFRGN